MQRTELNLGFATPEKLTAFLNGREAWAWKLSLVDDEPGMLLAIAELHQRGVAALCVDPHPDGSGGQSFCYVGALVNTSGQS